MYNLIYYFSGCIFISSFGFVSCSAGQDTLRSNIEKSVISTLVERYNGSNGVIEEEQLKALIEVSVGNSNQNVNASSAFVEEINEACSDTDNISLCKEVISTKCLNSHVLSSIYASTEAADWTDVFPALVYHHVSNACRSQEESADEGHQKPSSATAWAYGLGFSVLVIIISNIGGCMVPFRKRRFFHRILMFCVALAVGTLAGTGFLVLIPESMQLTGEDSPIPGYHFKLSTALGGIYFFYVSERLLKTFMKRKEKRKDQEMKTIKHAEEEIQALANGEINTRVPEDDDADFTALDVRKGTDANLSKVNSVAWLVLVGDALHNFVDGMSIGAAFTENVYTGISVSLAVLCEELPHELGDIAILHHAGLSMKKALLYNFLAALTVIIGLVIGIVLGENTEANTWIFACAGGMFIYISLVDILPEMSEQAKHVVDKGIESPLMTFIIQNVGLVLGFTIILLLAMFGKYIEV